MDFRDWFGKASRKDDVHDTKVLVCSLDSKFAELLRTDSETYAQFYPATTTSVCNGVPDLLNTIKGSDVVHLFADVSPAGVITDAIGNELMGTELITRCVEVGVKLLWIASDNQVDGYIKGFKPAGKPLNLVMTLNRFGTRFPIFLCQLLSRMSAGTTMPNAWVAVAPQVLPNDPSVVEGPSMIFSAGRGGVRLR